MANFSFMPGKKEVGKRQLAVFTTFDYNSETFSRILFFARRHIWPGHTGSSFSSFLLVWGS